MYVLIEKVGVSRKVSSKLESNSFVASPTRDATSYQRARDIDDPLRSLVTVAWTLDNLHSFFLF